MSTISKINLYVIYSPDMKFIIVDIVSQRVYTIFNG